MSASQGWNRFSYVSNNPVKLTDPSGHKCVGEDEGCTLDDGSLGGGFNGNGQVSGSNNSSAGGCGGNLPSCGGIGGGPSGNNPEDDLKKDNKINDILETIVHDDFRALEDNDCYTHSIGMINWTNSQCVDAASFFLQDLATLFSTASASFTAFITAVGCVGAAITEGVSCAVGYGVGYAAHVTFFNPYESIYSGASFFLTLYSDVLTHETYANRTGWAIGEDTRTGFVTTLAGTLIVEPFYDAGIDIYASGFNHGYFCGITPACIGSAIINAFH